MTHEMPWLLQADWLQARFVRRYKRFFADVQLADGEILTLHCPNTGSMMNCLVPGSPCYYSISDNPKRKLRGTLELVTSEQAGLVCVNTQRANGLVRLLLSGNKLDQLLPYDQILTEQTPPGSTSRIDFCLKGERTTWLEVKSVTLVRQPGLAEFPDTATRRGQKHLRELAQLASNGARAFVLFVVLAQQARSFSIAADLDPVYASIALEVARQGVQFAAVQVQPSAKGLRYGGHLPIQA